MSARLKISLRISPGRLPKRGDCVWKLVGVWSWVVGGVEVMAIEKVGGGVLVKR